MEGITGEVGLKLGIRIPRSTGMFCLETGHKTLLRSKDSHKLSCACNIPDDLSPRTVERGQGRGGMENVIYLYLSRIRRWSPWAKRLHMGKEIMFGFRT